MTRAQGNRIKLLTTLRLSVRHWPPSWMLTKVPANKNFLPGPPWPLGAA